MTNRKQNNCYTNPKNAAKAKQKANKEFARTLKDRLLTKMLKELLRGKKKTAEYLPRVLKRFFT